MVDGGQKMKEERRKHKRLDLDVSIELEKLDEGGITTVRYIKADVIDLSRSGMGFKSSYKLDVGTFYDTKIQIWTKEVIDAVIEVIRCEEKENNIYQYGATFVGMTETDILKIDIYQLFNEE